jgi:CRP-like cAMP-binding protein
MDPLYNIILNKAGLNISHYNQLQEITSKVHLKKNDFLLRPDSICNFIGFVEEGLLRSYIIKDGNEFNMDFYLPETFVSSYTSFLMQKPTKGAIQALKDTTLYLISYNDYNKLLESSNDWYRFGKYIADTSFVRKCRREASLLTDSALERYNLLLHCYPQIEQHVPQYHIASYLGIKPESLSRLKSLTYING